MYWWEPLKNSKKRRDCIGSSYRVLQSRWPLTEGTEGAAAISVGQFFRLRTLAILARIHCTTSPTDRSRRLLFCHLYSTRITPCSLSFLFFETPLRATLIRWTMLAPNYRRPLTPWARRTRIAQINLNPNQFFFEKACCFPKAIERWIYAFEKLFQVV